MKRRIMKKNINPSDYDYLWTDHGVNFIFMSCYLCKRYREEDLVFIYTPETNGIQFFISKQERDECSNEGLLFYAEKYENWERLVPLLLDRGKTIIQTAQQENVHALSLEELKERFLECVALFQDLVTHYYPTEFFFLDKIEQIKPLTSLLTKNIERMGNMKMKLRTVLTQVYTYDKMFKPYIEEIGKRVGRDDLAWLSIEEVMDVIAGKKVPTSKRARQVWVYTKHNDWNLIEGKEAQALAPSFSQHFFMAREDNVIGTIANKGTYRGIVKVLFTFFDDRVKREIAKVKKGDVLIANTTGPEVMEACQRAGAIITDEGGITSHAAVVSRELGIPCIVGTKKATIVFKDGDMVEVDANKGTVKKL